MTGVVQALLKPPVDVSAHIDDVTAMGLAALACLAAFFAVRPELWRRLWFDRVDPRPAALMRIGFGLVILITFIDLLVPHPPLDYSIARFLFTDEGLWLTDLARKNYGGDLKSLWDHEHGFEHWYDVFPVVWDRFTPLHMRSDPPFVFAIYGGMLVMVTFMIVGFRTRRATIIAFLCIESLYRYSPVFYTGGDTVIRVFLFLGMFVRWGEAYSVDAWLRRRRLLLGSASAFPWLRPIPAWPIRLMMLQLACIYCATGLLKHGDTWSEGTALYYALNLDHFYRWPQAHVVTVTHYLGILPAATIFVRWWEVAFPLALVGAALNAYVRERRAGTWPAAPGWRRVLGFLLFMAAWGNLSLCAGIAAYYFLPPDSIIAPEHRILVVASAVFALPILGAAVVRDGVRHRRPAFEFVRKWLLGRRFWLGVGLAMHVGIDVGMNVGTFAEVMIAVYMVWLTGDELDRAWRYLYSRPCAPGDGGRPRRSGRWRWLLASIDRLAYRAPRPAYVVRHHPGVQGVRRAALLRAWDLAGRLAFDSDATVEDGCLRVVEPGGQVRDGHEAAAALCKPLPGLVLLRPLRLVPGVGAVACWLLGQRVSERARSDTAADR